MNNTPYKRIVEERIALKNKLDKLNAYMRSIAYTQQSSAFRRLLEDQHKAMYDYHAALVGRLDLLRKEDVNYNMRLYHDRLQAACESVDVPDTAGTFDYHVSVSHCTGEEIN